MSKLESNGRTVSRTRGYGVGIDRISWCVAVDSSVRFATSDWMLNLPRPITAAQTSVPVQFGNNKRASRDKSGNKYFSLRYERLALKNRPYPNNRRLARVRGAVNGNNSSLVSLTAAFKSVTCARFLATIQSACRAGQKNPHT